MPPKKPATKAATKPAGSVTGARKTGQAPIGRSKAPVGSGTSGGVSRGKIGPVRGRGIGARNVSVRGRGRGVGQPGKGGGQPSQKESQSPKKRAWTKEDGAARKIQTKFRQHLAKKELEKRKKEKEEYNALMDKIQKDAWVQLIKMERDEEEKRKRKAEEERRRKREEERKKKRLLEAAFDGENEEILAILEEVREDSCQLYRDRDLPVSVAQAMVEQRLEKFVDCTDANGNTPLSESASGGNVDTVRLLIDKRANINAKGNYGRTPLYRAAFAGHLESVKVLLENGGDPRIHADDGATPAQIASVSLVVSFLEEWDVSRTDSILAKMQEEQENQAKEERRKQESEAGRLKNKLREAEKEYDSAQKQLVKAYEELNKRIYEHDNSVAIGAVKPEVTLQIVHDAESLLEEAKRNAEEAQKKLDEKRLAVREQQNPDADDPSSQDEVGIKVSIRELDDVLLRDVGNRIASDGRWPLLIDPSKQAATFLRYRDTNYLNAFHPKDMEPESIRMSVLGAIRCTTADYWLKQYDHFQLKGVFCGWFRYGKFAVLDLREVDMWESASQKFDAVQKDLLKSIMTKEILKEAKYLSLVKKEDREEYGKNSFNESRISNFKFVIITRMWRPPEALIQQTYPIRIHIPEPLS
eukprot:m.66547 g.66547  ORF g.66547 m.66547 type:complete len:641 (+) comp35393_c0_seq2:388-2310(+)